MHHKRMERPLSIGKRNIRNVHFLPRQGEDGSRRHRSAFCRAVLLVLLTLLAGAASAAEAERPLVIRNVTVLTMTGEAPGTRAIENGAVLVRGGAIEAVGRAQELAVPEGAQVLDGQGQFLIPGLIDAHVHLDHPSVLRTFVDYGITTVLNMRGFPGVLRWRREIAAGKRTGPMIYTSGDIIESAPGTWEGFSLVTSRKEARALVRAQAAAGYDFIKVYHGIERKHLRALAKEARRAGLVVIGHAPEGMPPRKAARAGLVNFAHGMELLRDLDSPAEAAEEAREIARDIKRRGAWVTPNLVYLDTLAREQENPSLILTDPNYGRLHPAMRQWFDPKNNPYAAQGKQAGEWNRARLRAVKTLTKALHEAGVPLLAGSDALAAGIFPQSALFEEFRLLEEAGLSPAEVLATATARGGEFIRTHIDRKARLGVIAPGARADLLLVAHDPRARVLRAASIRGVIAAGSLHGQWGTAAGRLQGVTAPVETERAVSRIASLVRAGKVGQAKAVYDAVRSGRPGEILFHRFAYLNLVHPLMFEGNKVTKDRARLENAVIALNMYTDTYPDLHIGHITLARALAALGRCADAEKELDRARALSPGHPLIEETAEECD